MFLPFSLSRKQSCVKLPKQWYCILYTQPITCMSLRESLYDEKRVESQTDTWYGHLWTENRMSVCPVTVQVESNIKIHTFHRFLTLFISASLFPSLSLTSRLVKTLLYNFIRQEKCPPPATHIFEPKAEGGLLYGLASGVASTSIHTNTHTHTHSWFSFGIDPVLHCN